MSIIFYFSWRLSTSQVLLKQGIPKSFGGQKKLYFWYFKIIINREELICLNGAFFLYHIKYSVFDR